MFCVASVACGLAPGIAVLSRRARRPRCRSRGGQRRVARARRRGVPGSRRRRRKAIGIWTGIAAVGLAIGPTLGGILTEQVGWRSIFLFNPLIGIVAIVLTFALRRRVARPASRSFDVPGPVAVHRRDRRADVHAHPGTARRLALRHDPRVLRARGRGARRVRALRDARAGSDDGRARVPRSRVQHAAIYAVFADALLHLRHAVHHHAVLPERARRTAPRRPACSCSR